MPARDRTTVPPASPESTDPADVGSGPALAAAGPAWSSWEVASHGPSPRPDWVVTSGSAVDEDLGVLKTGKEADVHLVRRGVPGCPGETSLLAAKRYRTAEQAPDYPMQLIIGVFHFPASAAVLGISPEVPELTVHRVTGRPD